jgi:hypothetical protein
MRYALTSLVVYFRSSLGFFAKRDTVMARYHPNDFQHWMRGANHFNLVDPQTRRVIRFEARRVIVRVEGQDSYEPFQNCLAKAADMVGEFGIADILRLEFESVALRTESRSEQAKRNFAEKFLSQSAQNVFPKDRHTDYSIAIQRNEVLGRNFSPIRRQLSGPKLHVDYNITLGPVTADEIRDRWLEFKEKAKQKNELYQTNARTPNVAIAVWHKIIVTPDRISHPMAPDVINTFSDWALKEAQIHWHHVFGED